METARRAQSRTQLAIAPHAVRTALNGPAAVEILSCRWGLLGRHRQGEATAPYFFAFSWLERSNRCFRGRGRYLFFTANYCFIFLRRFRELLCCCCCCCSVSLLLLALLLCLAAAVIGSFHVSLGYRKCYYDRSTSTARCSMYLITAAPILDVP